MTTGHVDGVFTVVISNHSYIPSISFKDLLSSIWEKFTERKGKRERENLLPTSSLPKSCTGPELTWSKARSQQFVPGLSNGCREPKIESSLAIFPGQKKEAGSEVEQMTWLKNWTRPRTGKHTRVRSRITAVEVSIEMYSTELLDLNSHYEESCRIWGLTIEYMCQIWAVSVAQSSAQYAKKHMEDMAVHCGLQRISATTAEEGEQKKLLIGWGSWAKSKYLAEWELWDGLRQRMDLGRIYSSLD